MHSIMKQSFIQQRKQPQGALPGWTQQSASAAPSQSASSVVISPGSCNSRDTPSESSGQSGPSLKEHDYIGLAEVSSASSSNQTDEAEIELNLAETDLRLGLGPATEAPVTCLDRTPELKKSDVISGRTPLLTSLHRPEGSLHCHDDTHMLPSLSSTWQSIPLNSVVDVMPNPPINGFQGPAIATASKNGGKRMYSEAMVDPRSTINFNSASAAINSGELKPSANAVMSIKQLQDSDIKSHTVHSQAGLYWSAQHVTSWQPQAHHCAGTYHPVASQKGMIFASGEKDGDAVRNSNLDLTFQNDSSRLQPIANEDNGPDEAPPAKGQVIGWPPVRSYRRSTLATRSKPAGDEGESQSAIYVKVNMDGIPIGRKVDLNAYKSYDGLLSALEDMFHNPNSGHGARFLKGSEFVLTYEDKEGDWMLVGDVPWGMFVNTVRRLRITRGSDMTGLGSRTSACQA